MSNSFNPAIGELQPKCWLALTELLADGDWHDRDLLETVGSQASGMQPLSVRAILESAKRAGLLDRIPIGRIRPKRVRRVAYRVNDREIVWVELERIERNVLRSIQDAEKSDDPVVKA